ncbi:hypothetical protein BIV60_10440 [Bacillus sp. MUM 116]|uniref:helix-turn-helix transcriptional regulator n=1 Tax=Bacillus sp. MUM 116 TaxID=1678002 RepID=UPI0008F58CA9|nr:helix-turn-helix transcriptional regulator [Bacillus sp. MUM 116]OIK15138.1 hypothetical protein BIV60_10440 [Bacillus sp. MUM 116]
MGKKCWMIFIKHLKNFNYKPNHSEVYIGLHELLEDGIITRSRIIKEGSKRKELKVYEIANMDEAIRPTIGRHS